MKQKPEVLDGVAVLGVDVWAPSLKAGDVIVVQGEKRLLVAPEPQLPAPETA
ncbi:MAG: hypothetical protein ACH37Z_12285 [Anaerolineae bacterium]